VIFNPHKLWGESIHNQNFHGELPNPFSHLIRTLVAFTKCVWDLICLRVLNHPLGIFKKYKWIMREEELKKFLCSIESIILHLNTFAKEVRVAVLWGLPTQPTTQRQRSYCKDPTNLQQVKVYSTGSHHARHRLLTILPDSRVKVDLINTSWRENPSNLSISCESSDSLG